MTPRARRANKRGSHFGGSRHRQDPSAEPRCRTGETGGRVSLARHHSAMEGMPPYLPFLEALGQYIRAAPLAQLRKQIGAHAPTLASLFPEIAQRLGNLPPASAIPPEQARFRLYEAIALFYTTCLGVGLSSFCLTICNGPMPPASICWPISSAINRTPAC